jgi:hypothetical protein
MKKILFASMIALAGCGGPYTLTPAERDTTELGAVKFSQAAGYTFVSCSGQDSDRDSYVTCTMKKPEGNMFEALCSYTGSGCKAK